MPSSRIVAYVAGRFASGVPTTAGLARPGAKGDGCAVPAGVGPAGVGAALASFMAAAACERKSFVPGTDMVYDKRKGGEPNERIHVSVRLRSLQFRIVRSY